MTQAQLAVGVGRDVQTVSRWERGERRMSADDYQNAMAYLDSIEAAGLGQTVPRGTTARPSGSPGSPGRVSERRLISVDTTEHTPRAARAIGLFEREAARLGATDAELDHIHWSLHHPQNARMFYLGDDDRPLAAAEQDEQLGYQMDGLRLWLSRRIEKRKAAGRQTVIADEADEPTRPSTRGRGDSPRDATARRAGGGPRKDR